MVNSAATGVGELPADLPSGLLQVVTKASTSAEQASLRSVFEASARTIGALGELDLARFEADDEGEEAYQVWEELAPVVGDTMAVTHQLVEAIDKDVPKPTPEPTSSMEKAAAIFGATLEQLRQDVQAFRDGLRQPENMANRWNVLSYLAAFRGRTRARVGAMVFEACGCFGPVNKADVVPHYRQDMEQARALRRALAGLGREVAIIGSQMELAGDEAEIKANASLLHERLEGFTGGAHYRQLRVADRRLFVHALAVLTDDSSGAEITAATSELFEFLRDISINRREMLVYNDQEALSAANASLAAARAALAEGIRVAQQRAAVAIEQLERLEGRNPSVDSTIDEYRGAKLETTSSEQLLLHLGVLEGALGELGE